MAIVEDNPGLRRSLETMLNRASGIRCVGAFPDGEQALRELPALRPRVVMMDINLPGMSGVQCVAHLARDLPDTQIIMLTVYDNTDAIFDSLAAGASGYLLKPVRAAQLVAAVKEVVAGGAPMSSSIARRVVQTFKKPAAAAEEIRNWPHASARSWICSARDSCKRKSRTSSISATGPCRPISAASTRSSTSTRAPRPSPSISASRA